MSGDVQRATHKLLRDHQAIIDAWYAEWLKQQKARIDNLWARKRRALDREDR